MRNVLIATAVALVAGAPFAFAAKTLPPTSPAIATTVHCSSVNAIYNRAGWPSESAFQLSLQQAQSFCRYDNHKNTDRTDANKFK